MKSKFLLLCVLACFLATCGSAKRTARINGGSSALTGEFKYVVGVLAVFAPKKSATCTGGIIHVKFILTAAHCLTKELKENHDATYVSELTNLSVFVYANATNFVKNLRDPKLKWINVVKRKAVKAYFVPEFFRNGLADIAVVELESPLNLNDGHLQKLRLPSVYDRSYEDVQAVLAGFGRDNTGANDYSLKKAHFRVVPFAKCNYAIAESYRQKHICAMAVTEYNKRPVWPLGACTGDSGGPLVYGNTVIGILTNVARSSCDARDRYPQIFAEVKFFTGFINSVIGKWGNYYSVIEHRLKASFKA